MRRSWWVFLTGIVLSFMVYSCGGGSSGSDSSGSLDSYSVGGTVSGLTGTVVLQINGGNDLTITSDGPFTFSSAIPNGSSYAVTVKTHPSGQFCTVSNSTGTVSGANVTNITVTGHTSGTLDSEFDTDGYAIFDGNGGAELGYSVAVDDDGKILVAGESNTTGSHFDMTVWRYNQDGTLDTSFGGGDGVVAFNNAAGGGGNDVGNSIIIDSNGKILVSGSSERDASHTSMAIWRLNSDGSLDTAFAGTGYAVPATATGFNGNDIGHSITLDATGRIMVAGESEESAGVSDVAVWRYRQDGTPDTSFGTSGVVTRHFTAGGTGSDIGRSITVDASWNILVAGESRNASNIDMAIWRFTSGGVLDTTFAGGNGYVVHNSAASGNGNDAGYSIAYAGTKIYVAGYSKNASNNKDMAIWRYNSDGTLDTAFAGFGFVTANNASGGNMDDWGYSMILDAGGRILVTGASQKDSNTYDMALWRYKTDGSPDTVFGPNGVRVSEIATTGAIIFDAGYGITLDSLGRILVAGHSTNDAVGLDMTVWRYYP